MLAGGGWGTALRLGLAMLALQASIGSVNDIVDATADAAAKPAKPIPRGLVSRSAAVAVAGLGLGGGLLLAAPSGTATVGVAILGVAAGYAYDLWLKRSAWGPVAFAVGVPLLPVFAWVGVAGAVPPSFASLLPAAVLAGLGLALANALGDLEADRKAATRTAATRLGRAAAWRLHALCIAAAIVVAGTTVVANRGGGPAIAVFVAGAVAAIFGVGLTGAPDPRARRHGWEVEAAGVGVAAAGWFLAAAPAAS